MTFQARLSRHRRAARRLAGASLWLLCCGGCSAGRAVLVGPVRPPITPSQVQVYLQPPEGRYVEIANIHATSRGTFAVGTGAKIEVVVERLKAQAAKVGANGILLHGVGAESSGALGAEVSSDGGRSPYVTGLGAFLPLRAEAGDGVAIYLEGH